MSEIPLKIFDETLRDGEQQAGLFFSYEEKLDLSRLIVKTGVNYIDIMPIIDKSEEKLVKTLVKEGMENIVTPATMMGKSFIDQCKECGIKRIILFNAISDRLLFIRDKDVRRSPILCSKTIDQGIPDTVIHQVRQNMVDKVIENLRYATSQEVRLKVDFAAEDASRADFQFLVYCISKFKPYVEHFMLCDTVGVLDPDKTYKWVSNIIKETDNSPIAVHFHNDRGMALENTLQAVLAGVSMVSGTFGGIGERAGNVALEQVLNGLRVRFGIDVSGIDYDAIKHVTDYLARLKAHAAPPYSKAASRHETGIHVNGILHDRQSYLTYPHEEPEIWFGKCSGASNFEYIFEKHLNKQLSKDIYNKMRARIKSLSIKEKRCFSTSEIIEMYQQGKLNV